jgi:hypothetical protein
MTDAPTIYLTNWSSSRHRGPGSVYTIMARPKGWERGDGTVRVLVPRRDDLAGIQLAAGVAEEKGHSLTRDDDAVLDYQRAYRRHVIVQGPPDDPLGHLSPGALAAAESGGRVRTVKDGDTLCCACSRKQAAAGLCHRVWAAQLLRRAGWLVVLDGEVRS